MLYTTRDPREAERFVNNLPFEDDEKAQIKSHFSTIEELMVQMKASKHFNSKGGERWFVSKVSSRGQQEAANAKRTPDMDDDDFMAAQFIAGQFGCCDAVREIAKECNCSEDLQNRLNQYLELLNQIFEKYTGIALIR